MKRITFLLIILMAFFGFVSCPEATVASNDEMAVIDEMNYARTKPMEYVDKRLKPLVTNEINTYQSFLAECISEMESMKALQPLTYNEACYLAAKEWVEKSGPKGTVGHENNFAERITKNGLAWKAAGENCSYGIATPKEIVIQLLVDSGVESRGHRKNILSKDFTFAGAAIGPHKSYNVMCCIDFAR